MLTNLEAYSAWPSAPMLALSERGVQTDLIQIHDIDGLGPVKANVNTTPYGSVDGEAYAGSNVPKRNIVITVGLNPDYNVYTMEGLRQILYTYFNPKQPVRLVFTSDDVLPPVEITGICESVEPNKFSKDPEIQISIICADPYFVATSPTIVTRATGNLVTTISYKGNVPVGVVTKVTYGSGVNPGFVEVQIGDPSVGTFMVVRPAIVSPTKYFLTSSVPGNKYAQQVDTSTGVITNLLASLQDGAKWPTLVPGDNSVYVYTGSGNQEWEMTYYAKYSGL